MANEVPSPLQQLEAIVQQKQRAFDAAEKANLPREKLAAIYKELKEAQYNLVLLRNNILNLA
ncbi:MAG: hypothetical protein JWP69_962 [Flaviaesturariibacter sp.]|nr:hypothetical protein [Flaviaesturariibacter sp.]